jgi:DNA-binding GntR family transcriptional regulator
MRVMRAQKTRLRSAKPQAAQDVVFAWLKKHVVSLPRTDGTFLTEAEVCRATGMSRTPVREALLRLEAEGFLQIVPKKGAFVPPIGEREVEAIMQARALIEDFCVRRAVDSAEMLAPELDRLLAEQDKHQKSPVEFIELDREFHRAIVRAAGNPVLADFYETLRDRQIRMGIYAITASAQRMDGVMVEHQAIAEGVGSRNADRAAAATADHLTKTLAALSSPGLNLMRARSLEASV